MKDMTHRILLTLLITLGLFTAALGAPDRELTFSADKLDYDEASKTVRLIGNVKITSEDIVMTSPYAEYNTEKQVGDFQGGVKIVGPGSTAVGNRMKAFYGERRAVLTGNVRLVSERAPGSESTTPTVMLSDELEYFMNSGEGIAKGRVKVRQGNRRAFSDQAHYYKDKQIVIMEGNVRFEQGNEDWLTASHATMNLATETITAEGQVVARTRIQSQEKEEAEPEPKPVPRPSVMEPEYPLETVETEAPVLLPGLDD